MIRGVKNTLFKQRLEKLSVFSTDRRAGEEHERRRGAISLAAREKGVNMKNRAELFSALRRNLFILHK